MASDPYTHPKRTAERVEIWYSVQNSHWSVCAWLPSEIDHYFSREVVYKREKTVHPNFDLAVDFIAKNYVGGSK